MEEFSQVEMDNFISIMEERLGRNVFLDYLNTYWVNKDTILPSMTAFNQLSKLIVACFDRILKHDDRENGLKLIEIWNHFYIDQIQNSAKKKPLRMYLTKSIHNLGPGNFKDN